MASTEIHANDPEMIERLRRDPTSFDGALFLRDFAEVPPEVFACRNVEELNLYGIAKVPQDIERLAGLPNLRILRVGGTMTELPEGLGELTKIKQLGIMNCKKLKALPAAIGKMKGLTYLTVSESPLEVIPVCLWRLQDLEELYLPPTTAIDPGLGELRNLKILDIHPEALLAAAAELPRLVALEVLRLRGKADRLPETIGALAKLSNLYAAKIGLSGLPATFASLANLESLNVERNEIGTMVDVVGRLPKLRQLSFNGNPVSAEEKSLLNKLMRTEPQKRASLLKNTAPKSDAPEPLGTVVGMSAGLFLFVGDGKAAQAWDPEEAESTTGVSAVLGNKKKTEATGLVCSFDVFRGYGDVYRRGDEIVVIETYVDDEDEKARLAKPPVVENEATRGTFTVSAGAIALFASEFSFNDEAASEAVRSAKKGGSEECSVDDGNAVIIGVPNGTYEAILEAKQPSDPATQRLVIRRL